MLAMLRISFARSGKVTASRWRRRARAIRFRPWQAIWQCNDIRVTVTSRQPEEIEYDLGGSIWGGSRFTIVRRFIYSNGRPRQPL